MQRKHGGAGTPTDARFLGRRRFLAAAGALAAGGALLAPRPARGQVTRLTFQTAWTREDLFWEFTQDYAQAVSDLSGGLLRLDVSPVGTVARALDLHDAVDAGELDGGHLFTAYGVTRNKAYSLFGTPPSFGWDANTFLGWVRYGGGQELYEELLRDVVALDLVGFLTGPLPCQPLGWFNEEIRTVADLQGLAYRTAGLAADLMTELGLDVILTGADEIVPAFRQGLIEAAEFNNPSSDRALGLPDVARIYMLRSYHQTCECMEVVFNRTRYEALPPDLRAVLRQAAVAQSSTVSWKVMERYARDLEEMERQGVRVVETPQEILDAQLSAWDRVIEHYSRDPFFARVITSQKEWNARVVRFQLRNEPSRSRPYEHFFPKTGG